MNFRHSFYVIDLFYSLPVIMFPINTILKHVWLE